MSLDSVYTLLFLLVIQILVALAGRQKLFEPVFNILPSVFFIYFLPMLCSSLGLVNSKDPILGWVTANVLPVSLFLLLVTVDLGAIRRLGGKALGMFFIGSAGIISGTVLAYLLIKDWTGREFWSGFGALSASWTGGSANMIAVKEAMSVPDEVFLPMVVVDTVVPYVWMGILIAMVKFQPRLDRKFNADRSMLEGLRQRAGAAASVEVKLSWQGISGLLLAGIAAGCAAQWLAGRMPQIKDILSTYAWTIILVSILGLVLSMTPCRKFENHGASKVGYWLLYFVLTAIGAKASLSNLGSSVILIGAGFIIVAVHFAVLLIGAWLWRAPFFLVAAASQANIGGVASAPVVAAVYEPSLASVGLLLAVTGNIVGTYMGILCAHFCRYFVS